MPNPFDTVSCFFLKPVSGFFGCFANPRTAFGFKRNGVFNPHLSGVIISAIPAGIFAVPVPAKLLQAFAWTYRGHKRINYAKTSLIRDACASVIPTSYVISPDGRLALEKRGLAKYDTPEFEQFLIDLSQIWD